MHGAARSATRPVWRTTSAAALHQAKGLLGFQQTLDERSGPYPHLRRWLKGLRTTLVAFHRVQHNEAPQELVRRHAAEEIGFVQVVLIPASPRLDFPKSPSIAHSPTQAH